MRHPIPLHFAALLSALRFDSPQPERLLTLNPGQWEQLLQDGEAFRLLIRLRDLYPTHTPDTVRDKIDQALCDNYRRFKKIKQTYNEVAELLQRHNIEHVVLKGFAQCPDYLRELHHRVQSDIDIFVPEHSLREAYELIQTCGYEPVRSHDESRLDHLWPLVKRTNWKWRGNYCDPEMPVSWEVHKTLWNESFSRIKAKGLDQFWARRIVRNLDNFSFSALSSEDHLAHVALILLRDILLGTVTLHLAFELATFLEAKSADHHFWSCWQQSHHSSLRRLEVISFWLVAHRFGCRLSKEVREDMQNLSPSTQRWLELYSDSPFTEIFSPNKASLWLYLTLLESINDRRTVLLEQLLPTHAPSLESTWIQADPNTGALTRGPIAKRIRYSIYLAKRAVQHTRLLVPTLGQGLRCMLQ
jgi:hypothetical protein